LIAAISVGVFVFLLPMPITGRMAGIAIEARKDRRQYRQAAGVGVQALIITYPSAYRGLAHRNKSLS
jgi:hypothetical protein